MSNKEYYPRRRKFVNLRKKPRDKLGNHTYSKQLDISSKRVFLTLLLSKATTLEHLEGYNKDWCDWLSTTFNETRTRELNKVIYLEKIPFYSRALFEEFEDIYLAIASRYNPSHINFKRYEQRFIPKEYTIETLDSKIQQNVSTSGAFYYVLPKEYNWFELEIENKEILSTTQVNLVKSRAITLPKGCIYWGFTTEKSKPIFLNYFTKEEFDRGSKFKTLDRKRLLENNLRQRGFITNFVEGTLVWSIDEIPLRKFKRDILVINSGESLFKSFILKYTKREK